MMKNSSRIFQSVRSSYDLLQGTGYDGGPSLLDDLGRAASELSEIGTYSEQISSMASQTYDAYYSLDDIASGSERPPLFTQLLRGRTWTRSRGGSP